MATSAKPLTTYRLTDHARLEMARRQISAAEVDRVLTAPEQTEGVRDGRAIYQSRVEWGELPTIYELRVIVDLDREPSEVVTAYRSSKAQKYWRSEA